MFCSQCGKEIPDDSIFCYSCGSKIEIKEKLDTITETTNPTVKTEIPPELQTATKEKINQKSEQTDSSQPSKTISNQNKSNQRQYMTYKLDFPSLMLMILCVGGISDVWRSNHNAIELTTGIISYGIATIIFYQFRKYLQKKKYFIDKTWLSSCISVILSLVLFLSIWIVTINIYQSYQKKSDVNELMEILRQKRETTSKQDLEYEKMMEHLPKTESEVKDKILKIAEYENYLKKKREDSNFIVSHLRAINKKYGQDKSIDEQITKLENLSYEGYEASIEYLGWYKVYLVTADETAYEQLEQGSKKIELLFDEVQSLLESIFKSLKVM